MIQFLHRGEIVTLDGLPADVTVLEWLRERAMQRGTKEGCASGDCGACTVVTARLAQSSDGLPLRYESMNSCIAFVGALHGCQLITVEDLARGALLHPVQQAMVENHGSQCGFCTPGFIMSMFALYQQQQGSDSPLRAMSISEMNHAIDRHLGGNLCRCTGYRPIKSAMVQVLKNQNADSDNAAVQLIKSKEASVAARLHELNPSRFLTESSNSQAVFYQPESSKELARLKQKYPGARLLAGGTDLALEVTQFLEPIDTIIHLKNVPELMSISDTAGGLTIGGAVSLTRCLEALETRLPAIVPLLLRYGSEQIRNSGTIGGNIANASPIGDFPPALIAANAILTLSNGKTSRTAVIEDFFKSYKVTDLKADEWVQSVFIPNLVEEASFVVHKISKRLDDDISAVCGAFYWERSDDQCHGVRIAFGGMAAIPQRASHCEAVLNNKVWSEELITQAQRALESDFQPIDDARASAHYRTSVAKNLLKRVWLDSLDTDILTHVQDYVHG